MSPPSPEWAETPGWDTHGNTGSFSIIPRLPRAGSPAGIRVPCHRQRSGDIPRVGGCGMGLALWEPLLLLTAFPPGRAIGSVLRKNSKLLKMLVRI